ncbi:MAG TPA: carboxypeptidase-like regulatory domain-containing protein, partial [Acidobacteriota bacterium]
MRSVIARLSFRSQSASQFTSFLRLVLTVLLGLVICYGQTVTGTLSGTVSDATRATVPGATVTATNVNTGIETVTTTDLNGNYIFPSLNPGTYAITVTMPGFKSTLISNIKLLVDQKASVDAQLEVGEVSTKIEITGTTPLLQNATASVGTVIGEQEVVALPLNLRRYGALAVLGPGAVTSITGPNQTGSFYESAFSETTYNSNGARSASNNYLIDGIDSRNTYIGGFSVQPPPDAVQEFKIQTNVYDAAFGKSAGSTINLVLKSGTNDIHGVVYEFLRNDKLDARNFFATNQIDPVTKQEIPGSARPKFIRNQFGVGVGGPIRKDKTFFFANYEGTREQKGLTQTALVPTDAQKAGDFSSLLTGQTINLCGAGGPSNLNFDRGQLFHPASEGLFTCPAGSALAGSTILTGDPIPGNRITSIDPVAQKMLAFFPSPNRPGTPNFVNQEPRIRNDNQFVVRIDHSLGQKDQLSGRYVFGQSHILGDPTIAASALPVFASKVDYRGQNAGLSWTHTFGPRLLNEARIGYQRERPFLQCAGCPRPPGTLAGLGIKNLQAISPALEGLPAFVVSNFLTLGDATPTGLPGQHEVYQDKLTWIRGRHVVALGIDMQLYQILRKVSPALAFGRISFDGRFSSLAGKIPGVGGVAGLADFLLGYPDTAQRLISWQPAYYIGGGYWNFYAHDDFKISRNLTLNMGLRYEYRRPPEEKGSQMVQFQPLGPAFSGPGNGILVSSA